MGNSFVERIEACKKASHSELLLRIAPRVSRLPLPMQRYDDPFLPFGKAIISVTRDLVCGYVFDFASYLAIGAAGAVALERTVAYVGKDHITILDGPFADAVYLQLCDETSFNVDGLTVVDAMEWSACQPQHEYGLFISRKGVPSEVTLNSYSGVYWADSARFSWAGQNLQMIDMMTYLTFGEDFADRLRDAIGAYTQG